MSRPNRLAVGVWAAVFLASSVAFAQRKKKTDEELTQVLELPPDPPSTVTVDTSRLNFVTVPLTAKGLLSQQIRDSLKVLLSSTRGMTIVKIRAFVAGTGDMRRVQSIVSEVFTDKKQPLPVLSVVQVGGLPLEAAQVQIEAWVQEKKPVNPAGIVFLSGQQVAAESITPRMRDLTEKSMANLRIAVEGAGSSPSDVLRVTCFLTSLEDIQDVRGVVAAVFPRPPVTFVMSQRAPAQSLVECEAVARLKSTPAQPVAFLNPAGLTASPNYSQAAAVNAPKLILAGSQLAFRYTEADARLAFQRLDKTLQGAGTSLKNTVFVNTYPLSQLLADLVRKVRFDYLDKSRPPASTMLPFEGLPSMDGAFSLEVVALPGQ